MSENKHPSSPPLTFRAVKRKAVRLQSKTLVRAELLREDLTFPLAVYPALEGVDLATWAGTQREWVEEQVFTYGAVLFRGFGVNTGQEFERVAQAICPGLYGEYGDLPREVSGEKIYGSTVYPPDKTILFHNESSHLSRWPLKIMFCCITAARKGGETPILDCREVYRQLDPELRSQFEERQLMYVRTFIEGLDVPWQEFFRTEQRSDVEAVCRRQGMLWEWLGKNDLKVKQIVPAVRQHPKTGDKLFFNQIQLHHIACLDQATRDSLLAVFGEERLPRNVYFGDGSPIPVEVMGRIGQMYDRLAVQFPWEEGDLIVLDNMRIAHSRNPFEGPRKILVALGDVQTG